jgi:hypothetical protein
MDDTITGHAVRRSLEVLANSPTAFTDTDRELLRQRVDAVVDELKSTGWPIERIIIRIKEVALETGALGRRDQMHSAVTDAVRWSIARYYR